MSSFLGLDYFKKNADSTFCYYRSTLSHKGKVAYDRIRSALFCYAKKVTVSNISNKELGDIFQKLVHDNPCLFYVEQLFYRQSYFSSTIDVTPKYRFDINKTDATLCAIINSCKAILNGSYNLSSLDKELIIHNYFCKNIFYDNKFADSSYECVGPLLFGKGVCEGISKATKLLCDIAGLKCIVLHGESTQEQLSAFSKNNLHTWNIVAIGDKFYHLDVTFDLTIMHRNVIRYDYFNLSQEEIELDHKITTKNLPSCQISGNYYVQNSLYMHTTHDFENYLKNCIAAKNTDIVFKLPQGNDVTKLVEKLIAITQNVLSSSTFSSKKINFSYNKYQRVFHLYIE